jgi:TPR repeat protein
MSAQLGRYYFFTTLYFRLAADQGYAKAQYDYGVCLATGEGVSTNLKESIRFFKLSADQGLKETRHRYACCLRFGCGVLIHLTAVMKYYRLSVDQGSVHGQFSYAIVRLRHVESPHDCQEITRYLQLSAYGRCELAAVNYVACLFGGFPVGVDLCEAARYFRMASCQGNAMDHSIIDFAYLTGKVFQLIEVWLLDVLKLSRNSTMLVALWMLDIVYTKALGLIEIDLSWWYISGRLRISALRLVNSTLDSVVTKVKGFVSTLVKCLNLSSR